MNALFFKKLSPIIDRNFLVYSEISNMRARVILIQDGNITLIPDGKMIAYMDHEMTYPMQFEFATIVFMRSLHKPQEFKVNLQMKELNGSNW